MFRISTRMASMVNPLVSTFTRMASTEKFFGVDFFSMASIVKVLDVVIIDESRRHALVEVSDDQFSLAIGKKGQNVRLAAKLTGWKIDVRSPKGDLSHKEVEIIDEPHS